MYLSDFHVTPDSLMLASSMVATSGAGSGAPTLDDAGAAAQTPVAPAWSAFVDDADRTLKSLNESVADLAKALRMAATAYSLSDQAAATSMRVHK
jgi:hypothetical protein